MLLTVPSAPAEAVSAAVAAASTTAAIAEVVAVDYMVKSTQDHSSESHGRGSAHLDQPQPYKCSSRLLLSIGISSITNPTSTRGTKATASARAMLHSSAGRYILQLLIPTSQTLASARPERGKNSMDGVARDSPCGGPGCWCGANSSVAVAAAEHECVCLVYFGR